MHIVNCAKIGADVMTGPLSAIYGLLKHPLTGLAQFVADFEKEISKEIEVFIDKPLYVTEIKVPFASAWDFIIIIILSYKRGNSLEETSPKPMRNLSILTEPFIITVSLSLMNLRSVPSFNLIGFSSPS
jgi:hypothetical protein